MKRGWSILLAEHVDAHDVGHGDTADFQVVCEVCREPVFKTERGDSHFLSHYPSAARWAAECELRVARSISESGEETLPTPDRGQSLRHYLRTFESMLLSLMPIMTNNPMVRKAIRSDGWSPFRTLLMKAFREDAEEGGFAKTMAVVDREEHGRFFRTLLHNRFPSTLSKRVQMERGADMAIALTTGPAARNLSLLMGVALTARTPLLASYGGRSAFEGDLGERISCIPLMRRSVALATIADLERIGELDRIVMTVLMQAHEFIALVDYVGFLPSVDGVVPKRTDAIYDWPDGTEPVEDEPTQPILPAHRLPTVGVPGITGPMDLRRAIVPDRTPAVPFMPKRRP